MGREFNKVHLDYFNEISQKRSNEIRYTGDISDFGNEVGYIAGKVFSNMTPEEIEEFITGFRHGVSLTNGTH